MSFAESLKELRKKSGKSRYRLAQWSGLSEAYLLRLETGERANPSRDVVLMLAFALVTESNKIDLFDIEEFLWSAGYASLRRRGDTENGITSAFPPTGQH